MLFGILPASAPIWVPAVIAVVFGIIVMAKPRVLAYLIGAYLLFIGIAFFVTTYWAK